MTRDELQALRALATDPALRRAFPAAADGLARLCDEVAEAWESLARDDEAFDKIAARVARSAEGADVLAWIGRARHGEHAEEPAGYCAVAGCIYVAIEGGRCWMHAPAGQR